MNDPKLLEMSNRSRLNGWVEELEIDNDGRLSLSCAAMGLV